jgi:hypothetical protein
VERVARIGDDPEGYLIGRSIVVETDSRARWFVMEAGAESFAKVYGSDGAYLQRFGQSGEGPGEFKSVGFLHEFPIDTLIVFDWGNGRLSRFTWDFRYIDQRPLRTVPHRAVVTTNGQVVINLSAADPSGTNPPMAVLGIDGFGSEPFGVPEEPYESGGRGAHRLRFLAASHDGGVWSSPLARYEMRHWDQDGKLTRTISRNVDWFLPHRDPGTRYDPKADPPNPKMRSLREDDDGRLWTLVLVPDEDWRESIFVRRVEGGAPVNMVAQERQYDTRIEVIDPGQRKVLASVTLPEAMIMFTRRPTGEVFAYSYHEAGVGIPYVDVWRFRLLISDGQP